MCKRKRKNVDKGPFIDKIQCTKTISTIVEQQATTNTQSTPHPRSLYLLAHTPGLFSIAFALSSSLHPSVSIAIIDHLRWRWYKQGKRSTTCVWRAYSKGDPREAKGRGPWIDEQTTRTTRAYENQHSQYIIFPLGCNVQREVRKQ